MYEWPLGDGVAQWALVDRISVDQHANMKTDSTRVELSKKVFTLPVVKSRQDSRRRRDPGEKSNNNCAALFAANPESSLLQ